MAKKKPAQVCKWLREHNASMKPKAIASLKDRTGYEYIGLDNGQIVHQRTAKRMGVL